MFKPPEADLIDFTTNLQHTPQVRARGDDDFATCSVPGSGALAKRRLSFAPELVEEDRLYDPFEANFVVECNEHRTHEEHEDPYEQVLRMARGGNDAHLQGDRLAGSEGNNLIRTRSMNLFISASSLSNELISDIEISFHDLPLSDNDMSIDTDNEGTTGPLPQNSLVPTATKKNGSNAVRSLPNDCLTNKHRRKGNKSDDPLNNRSLTKNTANKTTSLNVPSRLKTRNEVMAKPKKLPVKPTVKSSNSFKLSDKTPQKPLRRSLSFNQNSKSSTAATDKTNSKRITSGTMSSQKPSLRRSLSFNKNPNSSSTEIGKTNSRKSISRETMTVKSRLGGRAVASQASGSPKVVKKLAQKPTSALKVPANPPKRPANEKDRPTTSKRAYLSATKLNETFTLPNEPKENRLASNWARTPSSTVRATRGLAAKNPPKRSGQEHSDSFKLPKEQPAAKRVKRSLGSVREAIHVYEDLCDKAGAARSSTETKPRDKEPAKQGRSVFSILENLEKSINRVGLLSKVNWNSRKEAAAGKENRVG